MASHRASVFAGAGRERTRRCRRRGLGMGCGLRNVGAVSLKRGRSVALRTEFVYFREPRIVLGRIGMLARAHGGHLYFHAGEAEDAPRNLVGVVAVLQPRHERAVRAVNDNDARSFSFEQFYNGLSFLVEVEGKTREPDAVKQPLKNRGHTYPPVGVEDDQIVRPPYVLLHGHEIRFERLYLAVSLVQNGIEFQLADIEPLYLVARCARGALVGVGKLAGESREIGMPDEYKNLTAGNHGASVA